MATNPFNQPTGGSTALTDQFGSASLAASDNATSVPSGSKQDSMWQYAANINESNWNQTFPYQLAIYQKDSAANWIRQDNQVFTLPIPPTDLSRDMPAAMAVTVTLGGIVEENNGAPLRNLTFSGTTGVLPLKSAAQALQRRSPGESIFGGTLQGVRGLTNQLSKALNGPQSLYKTNLFSDSDIKDGPLKNGTGYAQFRMLEQFLDNYLALKKTTAGRNFVLAIELWKDEAIFLVTPQNFSLRRNGAKPLEYQYSLSFKAWKRIIPNKSVTATNVPGSVTADPAAMNRLMVSMVAARGVLANARATIEGVRGDVNNLLFEPLRQAILFAKDAQGVALTLADLPSNIAQDCKFAILEAAGLNNNTNTIFQSSSALSTGPEAAALQQIRDQVLAFSVSTSKASTKAGNLSGTAQAITNSADVANKILNNPQDNFDFFNSISVSSLNISPALSAAINQQLAKSRTLTRVDFEDWRNQIFTLSGEFANSVGASDATYNAIYGLPPPDLNLTPTDQDYQILETLNETIQQLDKLAATQDINNDTLNVMQYVAGLVGPSGISFNIPTSKIAVPFPYGSTLEQISQRYLGSPDRWIEIVTINNLVAPYIDEVGFDLPLQVPGSGHIVVVTDASNLFVGQSVWLSNTTLAKIQRTIDGIEQVGSQYQITLNGDGTLGAYGPANSAVLHAYLPNTVNSQQVIFIPDNDAPQENELRGKPNEALADLERELITGGIDFLLTTDGDLAIKPDGDISLAIGLTNLVQRVRLAVSTPLGSLVRHPSYGLPLQAGMSIADTSAQQLLAATQALFIDDPAFTGVKDISIQLGPVAANIGMTVGIAGVSQFLPLSFEILR